MYEIDVNNENLDVYSKVDKINYDVRNDCEDNHINIGNSANDVNSADDSEYGE